MKKCEIYTELKVPCGSSIILRLDGRNFYQLTKKLGFKKPFDLRFAKLMVSSSLELFHEFNPKFIYTFSDELNILLHDIPFSGRLEKLDSVFASYLASAFVKKLYENPILRSAKLKYTPSFDCRIIPLSTEEMINYFQIRQKEAWRNCLNGYAYWTLRREYNQNQTMKLLRGMKSSNIHDLLYERGLNLNDLPLWQKRGVGLYKQSYNIQGYNPIKREKTISTRLKIVEDWELPIFSLEFFQKILNPIMIK